ncbi:MAG TPA: hemerythrin domain-containing protein [Kofleriaceae bacterium]|nr:hemerythrin domain-containing protein [Kofleriaceae bacterium]
MPREDRDAMEMLERCHHQLDQRLATLREAAGALATGGTESDLDDIHEVLRFLERGAVRHVDDEEQSLFPRLADHPPLAAVIATLRGQHRQHEQLHAELAELAPALMLPCPPEVAAALASIADRLIAEYAAHVELEDRELLPAARAVLDAAELETMLAEMQARRGR